MIKFNKKKGCCNVPYSVNISVTERCPLTCPFCFHEYDHFAELSYQQICDYIDELSQLGTAQVQFSGGEPLVYPYILDSIAYAHLKGIRVVISSSGITVTGEVANKLKDAGLDCCYISLNGSTALIHEITREGYELAINALEIFKKVGLTTAINWVAYHENVRDFEHVVELAKSFNVKHISIMPMKQCGGSRFFSNINREDLDVLMECCRNNKDYLIVDSCFEELNIGLGKSKTVAGGCRAGKFYMAINAKGEFLSCPHLNKETAKVASIEKYWNEDTVMAKFRMGRKCACICLVGE